MKKKTKIDFLKSVKQHLNNGDLVIVDNQIVSNVVIDEGVIEFKNTPYACNLLDKMCLDDDLPEMFANAYFIANPKKEKLWI